MVKVWLFRTECFDLWHFLGPHFAQWPLVRRFLLLFWFLKMYSNKNVFIQVLSFNNKISSFRAHPSFLREHYACSEASCGRRWRLIQISSHLACNQWKGKLSLRRLGVGVYEVTSAPSEICELYDRVLLNLKTLALTKQKGPLFSYRGVRVCSFPCCERPSGNTTFQFRVSSTSSTLPCWGPPRLCVRRKMHLEFSEETF